MTGNAPGAGRVAGARTLRARASLRAPSRAPRRFDAVVAATIDSIFCMTSAGSREPPCALGVTRSPSLRRAIRRALTAAGVAVEIREGLSLDQAARAAVLIIDLDDDTAVEAALDELAGRGHPIILVGRSLGGEDIPLLRHSDVEHLIRIGDASAPDERILLVTAAKLVGGDIFGLDKYLAWGSRVHARSIHSYGEKRAALGEVAGYARTVGARAQLVTRIASVADELLMNALYDAPAIRRGVRRELCMDKHAAPRILEDGDPALLRYACDGRYFAVSVQDAYGELHKAAMVEHLCRARAERGRPLLARSETGGAGLGLYLVLSAATRFIANVEPGKRTEVICLFDLGGSERASTAWAQSLHIFHARD